MRIDEESDARLAQLVADIADRLGLAAEQLLYTATEQTVADADAARRFELRTGLGAGALRPQRTVTVGFLLFGKQLSVGFPNDCDTEEAAARLASEIQDQVLERFAGEARPACPGHTHPMTPDVVDGTARWVCPHGRGAAFDVRADHTG